MNLLSSFLCIALWGVLWLLPNASFAQEDYRKKADHAFRHDQYQTAVELYNKYGNIEKDKDALARRAIAHFHTNHLDLAIADLTASRKLGNKDKSLYWYMAQCHQHNKNWKEAIYFYTQYLQDCTEKDPHCPRARIEMKNCIYNIEYSAVRDYKSYVQPFGDSVNTVAHEFAPVLSPQFGNIYYFSRKVGNKVTIMAMELLRDGRWQAVDLSEKSFETTASSFIHDIDGSGRSLLYTEQQDQDRLYISYIDTSDVESRLVLNDKVFNRIKDLQIVDDLTIAFASDEIDGFGGYDIYISRYLDGVWQSPENAGPSVNTPFNERSPYFSPDRTQLFFSSDRPYAHGGYDIYHLTDLDSAAHVYNLGPSINSTSDDLGFRIDADGQVGVFSSDRKSGPGGFDLYFAYLKDLIIWKQRAPESFAPSLDLYNTGDKKAERADNPVIVPGSALDVQADEPSTERLSPFPNTLFYQDSYDINHDVNKQKLKSLAEKLASGNKRILVRAHTDIHEPGLVEYRQYNTFKRALRVAEELSILGVDSSRISIESVADNYPQTRVDIPLPDSLKGFNKRISLMVIDPVSRNIMSDDDQLLSYIPEAFRDKRHELYGHITDDLYFSVQIGHSERMYKNAVLRLYQDVFIRRESLGTNRNDYYIGLYSNLEDAIELRQQMIDQLGQRPVIRAFYKGRRLYDADMKLMMRQYPDLKSLRR